MSNMMTKEFNLLDEKWIVVLDGNGAATEVSMLEAFRNAHEYKRLANELPTADVAILRLLLAVMYAVFTHVDVNGDRSELTTDNALDRWKELWRGEQFPCKLIEQYLEQYRERFYLVHPETPFYQAASLSGRKCTEYEAPKLIGDLSQSGNKPRLFMGRTSSKSIPKPEATRWLLHVNAFDDTSAKPSVRKSAGSSADAMFAPGAGWLGKLGLITVSGENLFQTLLLNFVLINDKNEAYASGKPIWEVDVRDTERSKIPLPQGLAELYTLQSRRLLLKYSGNDVTGYYLLGGDAFNKENAFTEPMTLWRKSDNDYTPRRHNAGKQLWRDFGALVQGGDDFKIPGIVRWSEILSEENIIDTYSFSAVGIQFGDKDFFVDDVYADSLSVNGAIFSSVGSEWQAAIVEILNVTENAVKVFGTLASDLALAEGRDKGERGKNLFPIRDAAKERAYFSLDIPFRNWLSTIDTTGDMDDIMTAWKKQTREIIKGLADGMLNNMSDAAFIGHNGKTALEAEKWFNINLAKALELSGE